MVELIKIVRRSFQADRRVTDSEITEWEQDNGLILPDDYRRFLLKWNGGTVSPYGFWPEADEAKREEPVLVELLLDWDEVLDESQLEEDPSDRTTPPQHLAIAFLGGSTDLMLSLDPDSHGRIRTWPRNLVQAWGDAGNDELGDVCKSFTDFLDLLRNGTTDLYHGFWDRPETAPSQWDTLDL